MSVLRGVGTGSGRFRSLEIVNSAVCEPIGEREVWSHGCVARDAVVYLKAL